MIEEEDEYLRKSFQEYNFNISWAIHCWEQYDDLYFQAQRLKKIRRQMFKSYDQWLSGQIKTKGLWESSIKLVEEVTSINEFCESRGMLGNKAG